MTLNRNDIIEIIGSFVPPALAVLGIARFVLLHPESPAWVVFHYFGMLFVFWYVFGKLEEVLFGDKVNILMRRLPSLVNLVILVACLGALSFLCVFSMAVLNPYLLLALACMGNYMPILLVWGLLTLPWLRKAPPPKKNKKDVPQPDADQNRSAPCSQVRCRVCGIPVTHWLRAPDTPLLNALKSDKYEDGRPLLPKGTILHIDDILEENEYFWGAENSQVIVNPDDLVNTRDGGVRNGCCGVDGADGINIFCKNNHPIGTEVSDCYQPEFIHLPADCIVIKSRSAQFEPIVTGGESKTGPGPRKHGHDNSYARFPDHFDAEKQIKIEAEFFRLALFAGLATKKEVVLWADRLIEKGSKEERIFDLSLAGKKSPGEVTRLLGQVPGQCELAWPIKILLALCHDLIADRRKLPREILFALGQIAGVNGLPEPVQHDIAWLEELRYMAGNDESANTSQAEDEIALYVAKYANYSPLVPHIRD